jgi:hypothetical protein
MKLILCMMFAAAPLLFAVENMEVVGSRVNIRKAPSVKGAVIGSVKAGDRVQVRQIKDGWAELEGRPGFLAANYLRKADSVQKPAPAPGKNKKPAPASDKTVSPPNPAAKLAAGQAFADLPVEPGSKRDVTVRGMLYPMKMKGRVRYALLKVVGGKYAAQCYIYVPDKDVEKYREFANSDVQLVGYWYKVPGWKTPVMQVRRIKGL